MKAVRILCFWVLWVGNVVWGVTFVCKGSRELSAIYSSTTLYFSTIKCQRFE